MIKGNAAVIAEAKSLDNNDPMNLVCWDNIENLPAGYVGYVEAVRFDPERDWGDIGQGDMLMPNRDLVDKIRAAAGIHGTEEGRYEPFYAEIDWNRLTCVFDQPPTLTKMLVGYSVTKSGRVLTSSGWRSSGALTVLYNAWDRLCSDCFGPEERYTNQYDSDIVKIDQKSGNKYYVATKRGGGTYNNWLKYDTRVKRQLALDKEIKFAQRKAETKALNDVTRRLVGMALGYKKKDIAKGVLYVSRVELAVQSVMHGEIVEPAPAPYMKEVVDSLKENKEVAEVEVSEASNSSKTQADIETPPPPEGFQCYPSKLNSSGHYYLMTSPRQSLPHFL